MTEIEMRQVRCDRGPREFRNWIVTRLQFQMASAPESWKPTQTWDVRFCVGFYHPVKISISQEKVLLLWKTSCLLPVPKRSHPSSPNDYRPIALAFHVIKVLERLLLVHLNQQTSIFQDLLQFAVGLELKMLSYTCVNMPIVMWIKQAALWGSCSLIAIPSSLLYCERNSRRHR